MELAARITARRNRLDLTQVGLAELTGLQPSAISQFESGARKPSMDSLIKLSNVFDMNVDELIGIEREDLSAVLKDPRFAEMIQGLTEFSEQQLDLLFRFYEFLVYKNL